MRTVLYIVILLLYFTSPALGAETPVADDIIHAVDSMMMEKRAEIKARISLTESESQKFWSVYDNFEDEMRAVTTKIMVLMINVYAGESFTDEQADAIIEQLLGAHTDSFKIQQKYSQKFQTILPPQKTVQFIGTLLRAE